MKFDWSLLIICATAVINIILLVIIFKKNNNTKSLIIFMSVLGPVIILDILIGLVFGIILIIPLILISLLAIFISMVSLIYFINYNRKPQTKLIKANDNFISSEIIQIDISRNLLQISNLSSIINFIWFAPLMFLLFKWSTITAMMMSIPTKSQLVQVKLLVGIVNFIRTGGPLIIILFILFISIYFVIIAMIYTLTINGTIRYIRVNGGFKVNSKFLILMVIPIVNIFSNIYISNQVKIKLETSGLKVNLFEAKKIGNK